MPMPETLPADAAAAFAQAALQDYLDGAEEHLRRRLHDAGEAGIVVNVSIGAVSATVQPRGGRAGTDVFLANLPFDTSEGDVRPRAAPARDGHAGRTRRRHRR
jgi:hypothetical protein